MKRPWISRMFFGIAFLIALYSGLLIGVRIGTESGRSEYHNERMRPIHHELIELRRLIDTGDIDESMAKIERVVALAASAGDPEKFFELLSIKEDLSIEHEP